MVDANPWPDLLADTYQVLREPVAQLDERLLPRPTPCSRWSVADLFEHIIWAIDMFASGAGAPLLDRSVVGKPLERFDAAVDRSVAAWRSVNDLTTPATLAFGEFSAGQAAALNQFDSLVHAWDLAMALGMPGPVPDDLAQVALRTAEVRFRTRPRGDWFGPELPARDGTPQELLLALTGRDTSRWPSTG